jgi:hypothetical protein
MGQRLKLVPQKGYYKTMELERQKRGQPQHDKHTTSKEGIGNVGTVGYDELMGYPHDVAGHEANRLPIPRPHIGGGKKLPIEALGASYCKDEGY